MTSVDEKIYYKFVVDDKWIVDDNAPKEDDGHYNVNNVLLPAQIKKLFPASETLAGAKSDAANLRAQMNPPRVLATSSAPPGSNSNSDAITEAPTVSAGGDGAPLLTREQSAANLARWVPHVETDPSRPVTRTLPTEAATVSSGGEGAPLLTKDQSEANLARAIPSVTPNPDRPVTRTLPQSDGAAASKSEEKAVADDNDIPGAFPETPAAEPSSFGVAPLPATGHSNVQSSVTTSKEDYENADGEGAAGGPFTTQPILEPGQQSLGDSATTSKEAYDKVGSSASDDQQVSVNPLPATGHKDIQSSVTTSKEDYEKAGALGVAGAAIAGAGAYVASAFSKPKEDDKNVIPESSLPMNSKGTDTPDAGPFISSSAGPGTTTAELASKVPLEPKREAQVMPSTGSATTNDPAPFLASSGPGSTTAGLVSQVPLEPHRDAQIGGSTTANDPAPFLAASGAGSTTAGLASQVPLEPHRDAQVSGSAAPEAPQVLKDETASPFISSAGSGATTAALASQVPLESKREGVVGGEESVPPAVAADMSAVERELLQKVPESQATGAPASAAGAQTSYYGLATSVPEPVEKSISQAHASPEAATETSAVAEKSAMERELQATVPVVNTAGEPAPVLSAATSSTAPTTTGIADLTDGKTANQPVPGTDTSTQADTLSAGELAGGAAVGGAAAAGAATLAAKHENRDVEPPRVADASKPSVTTEAVPGGKFGDSVSSPVAGIGAASPHPGVSPIAGAALSDGTDAGEEPTTTTVKKAAPVETSEATATEYAPPRAAGMAPGVSPAAAAALSDGCEDPTLSEDPKLSEEPAVQMMKQNEAGTTTTSTTAGAPVHEATTVDPTAATTSDVKKEESSVKPSAVESSSAATASKSTEPATPKKAVAGASGSTASTPVRGTPESSTTGDKKKKRNRLSAMIKKIFD